MRSESAAALATSMSAFAPVTEFPVVDNQRRRATRYSKPVTKTTYMMDFNVEPFDTGYKVPDSFNVGHIVERQNAMLLHRNSQTLHLWQIKSLPAGTTESETWYSRNW